MATVTPRPIKGLTILIDFPDQQANITQAQIDNMLNQQNYTGFSNNGSVRDYYYGVSGGAIEYTNLVTAYYRAHYNKATMTRYKRLRHAGRLLITEALNYLKSIILTFPHDS
jgi:M6 family metalloprotease-like protein